MKTESEPPPRSGIRLAVIIPALNEAATVGRVVEDVQTHTTQYETRIVVADNGSTDATPEVATRAGAQVVKVWPRGYGLACREAIRLLGDWPEVLLFLDADGSSPAMEIPRLLEPLNDETIDLSLGQRTDYRHMSGPQRWGTWLATRLIYLRWGVNFQDMGPFRALRHGAYRKLQMRDRTWGWTVEMQIRAILKNLRVAEVRVSWLPRKGGRSKISGTVLGVLRAGTRILWTIGRHAGHSGPANKDAIVRPWHE